MTTATELLDSASASLRDRPDASSRLACWLSRSALEVVIGDLLDARGFSMTTTNMRTRLSCLEVAYQDLPSVPAQAQYAWTRLSVACHQHAYQLDPTYTEAEHLISLVHTLATTPAEMP